METIVRFSFYGVLTLSPTIFVFAMWALRQRRLTHGAQLMTQRSHFLAKVVPIAVVWFVISFILTAAMGSAAMAAEDENVPVPKALELALSIFFPMGYLHEHSFPLSTPGGLGEFLDTCFFMSLMVIDSVLSALVLVFLFQRLTRFLTTKKKDVRNAA